MISISWCSFLQTFTFHSFNFFYRFHKNTIVCVINHSLRFRASQALKRFSYLNDVSTTLINVNHVSWGWFHSGHSRNVLMAKQFLESVITFSHQSFWLSDFSPPFNGWFIGRTTDGVKVKIRNLDIFNFTLAYAQS